MRNYLKVPPIMASQLEVYIFPKNKSYMRRHETFFSNSQLLEKLMDKISHQNEGGHQSQRNKVPKEITLKETISKVGFKNNLEKKSLLGN